jgi:hypothetical protein
MGACTDFGQCLLWYIQWDGKETFSDFKPFAGWSEPALKQLKREEAFHRMVYDGDWCPAALPGLRSGSSTASTIPPMPPRASSGALMTGTQFIATLPPKSGSQRENQILNAVKNGNMAPVSWMEVTSAVSGHTLTLIVSADAMRIGTAEDSVRVSTTPRTMQQVADMLNCVLPTQRVCDLVWAQATVRATPDILKASPDMGDTSWMVEYNTAVDKKVAGQAGLIENTGKNWCLTNKLVGHPGQAANYGWYDASAPYHSGPQERGPYKVWQPLATAHNLDHVDYSQVVRLVSRVCFVDGAQRDLKDILKDATLAALASDEGPLQLVRLAGVDQMAPISCYPASRQTALPRGGEGD